MHATTGNAARVALVWGLLAAASWSCGTASGPGGPGAATTAEGTGTRGTTSRESSSDGSRATSSSSGEGTRSSGSTSGAIDSGPAAAAEGGAANLPDGGSTVTNGLLAFTLPAAVVTGVRGVTGPPATASAVLHNGGSTVATVTALSVGATSQLTLTAADAPVGTTSASVAGGPLMQIVGAPALPLTLGPGMDLPVTIQLATTGTNLPAAPSNFNLGSTLLTATLTATSNAGTARADAYGILLIQANYEPTLGQILAALRYKLDVGQAQNDWNPNTSMMATALPGVEPGTDEVKAPLFVKAGAGPVSMTVVARFSPVGTLPFGWYSAGTTKCPGAGCTTAGTMAMIADAQTSAKARMVYPPVSAGASTTYESGFATTFDPGTAPFGIWVYSDQATNLFKEGGNPVNGDYDYSEDALNVPAPGVHRMKSYPLKDATGTIVPQTILLAVEEAGNGDYQDYVFVLGNVGIAP